MNDQKKSLFRKSSLERVSSPDKLNEYIKINNPILVTILVSIFAILIGSGIWIFTGTIPKNINITGVATLAIEDIESSKINRVYSFVSLSTANNLKVGASVAVSPEYIPKEEYGYIRGKILKIGTDVITPDYLYEHFENPNILESVKPKTGTYVEVIIELEDWTNENSKSISIINGAICNISVITANPKAYEVILQ